MPDVPGRPSLVGTVGALDDEESREAGGSRVNFAIFRGIGNEGEDEGGYRDKGPQRE